MINFLKRSWNAILRYLPGIASAVFIVGGFITVSVWFACDQHSAFGWLPQASNRSFYLGVFAGMGIVVCVLPLASKGFAPFIQPLKHAVISRFFFWLLVISTALLFLTLHLADTLERKPGQERLDSWLALVEKNPGGIFAIFTGLATVLALI